MPNAMEGVALPLRVIESSQALLTKEDVAQRAGVSIRTVERWTSSGAIVPLRRGKWVRYTEAALEKFLRDSKDQARG